MGIELSPKPLALVMNSGMLANADSIMEALNAVVVPWGETRNLADTSGMPLHELLPLLQDCAFAVAPHGPQLANLIWLPKTSVIVEVVAEQDANSDYSYIATLVEVIHMALPATAVRRANRSSVLEARPSKIAEL